MIKRTLSKKLKESAKQFPVVTVTGPRQSGKTTIIKDAFKNHDYISLELPDQRAFAIEDPRGFLSQFDGPVILDEVQRTPELFSYIQVIVDENNRPGQFILSGSHNFLLLQGISQSLAGRCAVLHLLPFSLAELSGKQPVPMTKLGNEKITIPKSQTPDLMETLYKGFYPRIHDKGIPPRDWLSSYYQTYIERDVRNILNVGDIEAFERFVLLCAGRNGQLLNLSGLAADCGITHTTAKRWISVLEASFIIMLLRPYYKNFGKRIIKSPKLYFLDTGLLCYLLRIQSAKDLFQHTSRGSVFESLVVSDLYKNFFHQGEQAPIYFWRSSSGIEIDVLIDMGNYLLSVEIKSSQTIAGDFFKNLKIWQEVSGNTKIASALIYGGTDQFKRNNVFVYPWSIL